MKFQGKPVVRWSVFMQRAGARIAENGGWKPSRDPFEMLAKQIVDSGEGKNFLMAAPRRRPDNNTPESRPPAGLLELGELVNLKVKA